MPFIRCPACNARYKVPETAGGQRARCAKCGKNFRIPAFPPPPPPEEELRLTSLDALSEGETIPIQAPPPVPSVGDSTVLEAVLVNETATYAASDHVDEGPATAGAYGDYLRALMRSLAFPVRGGDLAAFAIVWVLLMLGEVAGAWIGRIGGIVSLVVQAWYMAFQLNIVLGAAGGEEELPTLTITEGWWDDLVVPLFKMATASIFALAPLFVFLVGADAFAAGVPASGGTWAWLQSLPPATLSVAGALALAGYFVWPMLVLVVAVGSFGGLVRADLIARTIVRSFPAYLLTVVTVYLSRGLQFGAMIALAILSAQSAGTGSGLLLGALLKAVELYCTIIAMRAIGLYYHHFKHRFAWSWG